MSTAIEVKKSYDAGITKRSTAAEMAHRRETLLKIAEEAAPASVRHLYYRAVVHGLVPKTNNGYQKVQREVLRLRRDGKLPFEWVVDEGRRAHWPVVERSPRMALLWLADSYKRDPWQEPGAPRVEVWCESESIAGMLMPLKGSYSVPIFPLKGQGSDTFAWNAARSYMVDRDVIVLYAGDYDPAGLQIGAQLEGKLRKYADIGVNIDFRRVSITDEQATKLQMLGTEPKQRHWVDYDGTRRGFVGQAVEAEAVDPRVMRELFADHIRGISMQFCGIDIFTENEQIEVEERRQLQGLARAWGGAR